VEAILMMTRILVTGTTVDEATLSQLGANGLSIESRTEHLTETALIGALEGTSAYLLGGEEIATRRVIEACPGLKLITFLGVGFGSFIDAEAATRCGVAVSNTPGTLGASVAELAVGLIIAARRQIIHLNNTCKRGIARPEKGCDLHSSTLGVIGMGDIGTRIATIMKKAFGMNILYYSRTRRPEVETAIGAEYVALDELLASSDIVLTMVSTSPETVGMIGQRELGLMKQSAILVNPARASIVDASALRDALKNGAIAGAAFDGYYEEPLPPVDRDPFGLLSLPDSKFILTPHVGALTHGARTRMGARAVGSIINFFKTGDDPYIVNPDFKQRRHAS
jgi:glyoxylate reductase